MICRWNWIANYVKNKGYTEGAELGCKEGRTTMHLLATVPDLRLHAVDLWSDCPGNEIETYDEWDWPEIERQFAQRVKPYRERLEMHRCSTAEMAKQLRDAQRQIDFAFIDADHSYGGVLSDIRDWWPLIRPGGTLIGHDIDWDSVRRAVQEYFGEAWNMWQEKDNVWWVEKQPNGAAATPTDPCQGAGGTA